LRLSPLRPWVWITQSILAAGCLRLVPGLFSPKRLRQDQDSRKLAVGGLMAFLSIGMYLFEHSKYCLFPSAWTALAFRSATLFVGGTATALLITALKPRAGRALLIFSGVLLIVIDFALCAIARFNLQIIFTHIWRLCAIDASFLGMAITAAMSIWRERRKPLKSTSEPPGKSGAIAGAV
jgi:hypothetical protein